MVIIASRGKTQLFVPVDTTVLKGRSLGHNTHAQEVSTLTKRVPRFWENASLAAWAITALKDPLSQFNVLQDFIMLTIIPQINA